MDTLFSAISSFNSLKCTKILNKLNDDLDKHRGNMSQDEITKHKQKIDTLINDIKDKDSTKAFMQVNSDVKDALKYICIHHRNFTKLVNDEDEECGMSKSDVQLMTEILEGFPRPPDDIYGGET